MGYSPWGHKESDTTEQLTPRWKKNSHLNIRDNLEETYNIGKRSKHQKILINIIKGDMVSIIIELDPVLNTRNF